MMLSRASCSGSREAIVRAARASSRWGLDLLHKLEADAAWSLDESDPPRPERTADDARSPEDVVVLQFRVQVVDEQGGVQEAVGRQGACLFVDGLGEQR